MGGPLASRMINTIDIDVLEQWWLAQFGLVAAGGPHNVQLWPSGRRAPGAAQAAQSGRGGAWWDREVVENPSPKKVENHEILNFH